MDQRDHQQDHQGDDGCDLTIGLDAADDVLAGLIDRVGAAGQNNEPVYFFYVIFASLLLD